MQSQLRELFAKPIAHRGLHDAKNGIIENSKSAFAAAISQKFAIECDIQLSADEKPMVFHDYELSRLCSREGQVNEMTGEALSQTTLTGSDDKIQHFSEFLEQVDGEEALFVELKDQLDGRNPILAKAVVDAAANYKGTMCFMSFNPELLINLRQCGFTGPMGIILFDYKSDWAIENMSAWQRFSLRHLLHYPRTRFDFIDPGKDNLEMPSIRFFRQLGFPTATWTIRSQQEADKALKHCDQITFEGFLPK